MTPIKETYLVMLVDDSDGRLGDNPLFVALLPMKKHPALPAGWTDDFQDAKQRQMTRYGAIAWMHEAVRVALKEFAVFTAYLLTLDTQGKMHSVASKEIPR